MGDNGIAGRVRDLLLEERELFAAEAYRRLKSDGKRSSYPAVQRLFYDLRQLGLIEFVRAEKGKAPIDRRYYRIVPGRENDPIWLGQPHHELYPASSLGGLVYRKGMSKRRRRRYAKRGQLPNPRPSRQA